jgi:hypothetical protein
MHTANNLCPEKRSRRREFSLSRKRKTNSHVSAALQVLPDFHADLAAFFATHGNFPTSDASS